MLDNVFLNLPTIETERLILRKLIYADRDAIYKYAANPKIAEHVIWDAHQSIFDTIEFLNIVYDAYNNNKAAPWGIQLKESENIIGTVGFVSWDREFGEAEIGYALSEQYWNKGIVTESVNACIDFGFKELGLKKIISRCKPQNIGSYKVLEKCGFNFDGIIESQMIIKGKPEDMRMYSLQK